MNMRVGQGFDVHAFGEGNQVMLGGIAIPHTRGLVAHSDGDVLIHALCDALLGAAGLGDIGHHFPDTDPHYKGASGESLLTASLDKVTGLGWRVVNVDITLLAQVPRVAAHRPAMTANLARMLALPLDAVNVKATTTERLGFVGREEGIAVQAICLLQKSPTTG